MKKKYRDGFEYSTFLDVNLDATGLFRHSCKTDMAEIYGMQLVDANESVLPVFFSLFFFFFYISFHANHIGGDSTKVRTSSPELCSISVWFISLLL